MTATVTTAPPAGLEHKSAAGAGLVSVAGQDEGVVEAIVSVTGVKDRVNDVILPGAYTGRPIGVWSHDDKMWASRTEDSAELPPGDPRLPATTNDGRPWPREAGGLWVKTRYNLDTRTGRDAYSNVKFFKDQTGWSIGYRVPPGGSYMRDGVRFIKQLEVWEYSPVMVGAASEPMTLSVKSGMVGAPAGPATRTAPMTGVTPDVDMRTAGGVDDHAAALHDAADPEIDWDTVAAADPGPHHNPPPAGAPRRPAAGWGSVIPDSDDSGSVPPGVPDDETPPEDLADQAEVKKDFTGAERAKAAKAGEAMPDGSYPIRNWSDLKNAVGAYGRAKDKDKVKAHIIKRARALKATHMLPDGWDTGGKKTAGLLDLGALEDALGAEREAKAGGADRNRGNAEQLRHWYVHGGGAAEIDWGSDGDFMRCVTVASKHMSPENARGYCQLRHHDATGAYAGHAPGEGKGLLAEWDPAAEVGPDAAWQDPPDQWDTGPVEAKAFPFLDGSFEAAQSLLRQAVWEQFRGDPKPDSDDASGGGAEDMAGDAAGGEGSVDAGGSPGGKVGAKMMPGDYDGGDDGDYGHGGTEYEWPLVAIVGTWPDRVVVTRCQWDEDGKETRETYEVPYSLSGDHVLLGAPAPADLRVEAAPQAPPVPPAAPAEPATPDTAPPADTAAPTAADAGAAPVAGVMDQAAAGLKLLLAGTEVKAGRVLSAANADRLRSAVVRLLEVLSEAGVNVDPPAPRAAAEMKGSILLDPEEYVRGLRLRAGL